MKGSNMKENILYLVQSINGKLLDAYVAAEPLSDWEENMSKKVLGDATSYNSSEKDWILIPCKYLAEMATKQDARKFVTGKNCVLIYDGFLCIDDICNLQKLSNKMILVVRDAIDFEWIRASVYDDSCLLSNTTSGLLISLWGICGTNVINVQYSSSLVDTLIFNKCIDLIELCIVPVTSSSKSDIIDDYVTGYTVENIHKIKNYVYLTYRLKNNKYK